MVTRINSRKPPPPIYCYARRGKGGLQTVTSSTSTNLRRTLKSPLGDNAAPERREKLAENPHATLLRLEKTGVFSMRQTGQGKSQEAGSLGGRIEETKPLTSHCDGQKH